MTTATPLTNDTELSVNVTTKSQEQILYQSKERSGVVPFFFGFKWTLNLSNFKHYSDNFVNMAFFSSCFSARFWSNNCCHCGGGDYYFHSGSAHPENVQQVCGQPLQSPSETRTNQSPCSQLTEHSRVCCWKFPGESKH